MCVFFYLLNLLEKLNALYFELFILYFIGIVFIFQLDFKFRCLDLCCFLFVLRVLFHCHHVEPINCASTQLAECIWYCLRFHMWTYFEYLCSPHRIESSLAISFKTVLCRIQAHAHAHNHTRIPACRHCIDTLHEKSAIIKILRVHFHRITSITDVNELVSKISASFVKSRFLCVVTYVLYLGFFFSLE